jgi:hypothetical protein
VDAIAVIVKQAAAVERTVSTTVTQTGTASTGIDHAHPETKHTVVTESVTTKMTGTDDDEMSQNERTATETVTITETTVPKIREVRKTVLRALEIERIRS